MSALPEPDIDARGMKCPWPALGLARAMREAENATIVADDPQAFAEISALAKEHGWSLDAFETAFGAGFKAAKK